MVIGRHKVATALFNLREDLLREVLSVEFSNVSWRQKHRGVMSSSGTDIIKNKLECLNPSLRSNSICLMS